MFMDKREAVQPPGAVSAHVYLETPASHDCHLRIALLSDDWQRTNG